MKGLKRFAMTSWLCVGLVASGAAAAGADEIVVPCPMGGMMVTVAVDKDKTVEWLEDDRRDFLLLEDAGVWQITTLSGSSDKIALVIGGEYVFFGVADDRDDREADENRMTKAFGNSNRTLESTVKTVINDMWKAQAIDIRGGDVSDIGGAVGIGVMSQEGDWALETADCQGMTVNIDELD